MAWVVTLKDKQYVARCRTCGIQSRPIPASHQDRQGHTVEEMLFLQGWSDGKCEKCFLQGWDGRYAYGAPFG